MYIIQLCTTLGGPNELVTFPDDVKSRLKREKNLVSSRATCLLLWLYLAMYLKWQAKEEEEEERGPATDYNRKRKTKKNKKILFSNPFWLPFKRTQKKVWKRNVQKRATKQAAASRNR